MFADKISLTMSETLLVAVAGIIVVMLELALLTVLILSISKAMRSIEGKLSKASEEAPVPALTVASAVPAAPVAPVAAAPVNNPVLVDVDDRSAAVIMAIVSDQTGIPLNQLSFKSIKKVED